MTSYESIFETFKNKVVMDTDFFMYNLPNAEAEEIIKKRCMGYLTKAIAEFKKNCFALDIDFNNKDDILEVFNFNLTDIEIDILVELMYIAYLSEDVSKLKVQTTFFSDRDLKTFSPANDRKTFMDMFNEFKKEVKKDIKEYESKDRLTGKPKKMDYSSLSLP